MVALILAGSRESVHGLDLGYDTCTMQESQVQ